MKKCSIYSFPIFSRWSWRTGSSLDPENVYGIPECRCFEHIFFCPKKNENWWFFLLEDTPRPKFLFQEAKFCKQTSLTPNHSQDEKCSAHHGTKRKAFTNKSSGARMAISWKCCMWRQGTQRLIRFDTLWLRHRDARTKRLSFKCSCLNI